MPVPDPTAFTTTNSVLAVGNDASPEMFLRLNEVRDIGDIGGSTTMHPTSSHSTPGGFMTQIPGMLKLEDIAFPLNFDPEDPQHAYDVSGGLGNLWKTRTLKRWLYYPVGFPTKARTFLAYVSKVGEPVPVDGVITLNVTLSPTGEPTYLDATALLLPDEPFVDA